MRSKWVERKEMEGLIAKEESSGSQQGQHTIVIVKKRAIAC